MPVITLYHGTAKDFPAFDERYALRGSEPNSALGIHLTEKPWLAADYAEMAAEDRGAGTPRVLVVEVTLDRVAVCSSAEDYLGRNGDDAFETTRSREEFVEARLRLQAEGFDAVATDDIGDDISACWAVFDPSRIRIVGRMDVEEAFEAEQSNVDGPDYAGVLLFDDCAAPALA